VVSLLTQPDRERVAAYYENGPWAEEGIPESSVVST